MRNPIKSLFLVCLVALLTLSACAAAVTPTPAPPSPTLPAQPTPMPENTAPVVPTPTGLPDAPTPANSQTGASGAAVLRVGSSLDNPPFSTYDEQFQPAGFEVALITEVARRLGMTPDISDFTFEGLLDALQLKQMDAAIGAIDITPERSGLVDFTTAYFMGEDGVLAAPGAPSTRVQSLDDLAGRRIGVQRASVYESWLTETLVATGRLPAENLVSYVSPDDAMEDLDSGALDLVIIDRRPAESYASQGKGQLVGYGLKPQAFAIAVSKGSALLPEINSVLIEMIDDGTVAKLITEYLQIPLNVELPGSRAETPTPGAAQPAPTTAACLDGMAWVTDLNADGSAMASAPVLAPGEPFAQSWRVKNAGSCEWTSDYTLTYVSGNTAASRMGGADTRIGRSLAPGETVDLSISLVAPDAPGVYQGFWQMENAEGRPFGERVWVGVTVAAPSGAAPVPTETPTR